MIFIKTIKTIKFIEKCNKEHTCNVCGNSIKKATTYFIFNEVISDNGHSFPAGSQYPKKVCYACYPEQRLLFRKGEKDVRQMQLGI